MCVCHLGRRRGLNARVEVVDDEHAVVKDGAGSRGSLAMHRSPSAEAAASVALSQSSVRERSSRTPQQVALERPCGQSCLSDGAAQLRLPKQQAGCMAAVQPTMPRLILVPWVQIPGGAEVLGTSPQGSFEFEWLQFMASNVSSGRAKQKRRAAKSPGGRHGELAWLSPASTCPC